MSDKHDTISLSGAPSDYSLNLNDSLASAISFNQSGVSVTLSGTNAGYAKVGDAYEWQATTGGKVLTITGLANGATLTEDMFTRDGDKITFKPTQALLGENPTSISISSGVIDTSELTTTKAEAAH